ncbi:hypothetical protein [Enterobacter hormaechei]|uniref:hypothetical protein n=1 Tax=Enterobacter hormaechei TaxID=158836 RepID=UPI00079B6A11|nr:hypothetical protein [Enterobacter hormaechei]CZZ88946.1 Uncharacterised protein [Enterobacter hormaechei]
MSRSPKEMYVVPEWMRSLLPLFHNTGGNDVEELLHDEDTNMFANCVRYMLIVSARSQFAMLMDMYSKGIITGRTGATKCSDTLTDGQLLFRLQDFYGAGQDAMEINDHEYAQECTDVVSIIREVIESRKALKAAEKRIAEMQALASGVKQFSEFQICHYGATEDYAKGYIDCQNNYNKVLFAATGKGE